MVIVKRNSKIALSVFAGTTAITALGMNRVYVKMRYGKKVAKPLLHFSEIAEGDTENVHLTAHRGLSAAAPENTLEAFQLAAKENYYALECDVHYTTDGKWVIIHDYNMQSMTERKGDVKDFSYEELKTIKFNNGANINDYPQARMCTVEEYLDICAQSGKKAMIEVKDKRVDKVESLYKIICDYGIEDSVIVISFHPQILREFRRLSPNMELWYLMGKITEEKLDVCIYNKFAVAFNAKRNLKNGDLIEKAHENDVKTACWTVDTKETLNTMLENGVKYITTNAILPD
ncbi:MAG: hypothetical protein J1F24_07190 [Oscillospiraceae bacterium]|nr:hypothetical protein [Oscillospiraceae bacterium]